MKYIKIIISLLIPCLIFSFITVFFVIEISSEIKEINETIKDNNELDPNTLKQPVKKSYKWNIGEYETMTIKVNRLNNAHNNTMLNFKNSTLNPFDYGFDVDSRWTDIKQKTIWCDSLDQLAIKNNVLLFELKLSLHDLNNFSVRTPYIQEKINESDKLLYDMSKLQNNQLMTMIEFNC